MKLSCFSQADEGRRAGYDCRVLRMEPYPSFELLLLTVGHPDPNTIVLLYRPPDKKHTESFIPQFSDFLATLMQSTDRALLVGDFNVHYDCPSRPIDKEFMELINSFGSNIGQWVRVIYGNLLNYRFKVFLLP